MLLLQFGEVLTLPVVVLISLMAQPRLQLALARDGLLPSVFGRVNASGNLKAGTLIAGIPMTVIATCVPFGLLDDLISSGILVAFSMTNACLILMRNERPRFMSIGLVGYNVLCFFTGMLLTHTESVVGTSLAIGSAVMTAGTALFLTWKCPRSSVFGRWVLSDSETVDTTRHFEAPCVPLLPFVGIFVNWKLISELDLSGLILLLGYLGIAMGLYLWFAVKRRMGTSHGWAQGHYEGVSEGDDHLPSGLMRSISLKRIDTPKKETRTLDGRYEEISDTEPDSCRSRLMQDSSRNGLMRSASMPRVEQSTAPTSDEAADAGTSTSSQPNRALHTQQTI